MSFPQEFGIDGPGRDEWIVGLINSIIFLTAGLIGAFIVDPLNHWFGRRGEIFITALCLTATPIGSGFAKSWEGLFAARFVMVGIRVWQLLCSKADSYRVSELAQRMLRSQSSPQSLHPLVFEAPWSCSGSSGSSQASSSASAPMS